MAFYKVIQDVEAEDKLLGPLTFRQFVYAGAAGLLGYLSFFLITHGAIFLAAPFIPFVFICGFFAWPWGRDQPTEIWALAQIRFFFKPRRRIWNQTGTKELVTITVPKKIDMDYTNGLSQSEVKSRLQVLANTLDSHGWVIKDVNINLSNTGIPASMMPPSDRLIPMDSMPKPVPDIDVRPSDDILDAQNNPIAQQFDSMIAASAKSRRAKIIADLQHASPQPQPAAPVAAVAATLQTPTPPARPWFLDQQQPAVATPQDAVTFNAQVVMPGSVPQGDGSDQVSLTTEEQALIKELTKPETADTSAYSHLHTIQPLSAQASAGTPPPPATTPSTTDQTRPVQSDQQQVTGQSDTGILDLANNDDLNVATIAREANKRRQPSDEVVIELH